MAHTPCESSFFTTQNERNPIDRLQFGIGIDHDELVSEHFIYVLDSLVLLLAHIFKRAISEGFPTSWTEYTIVPIFKSGEPMMPIRSIHCILFYEKHS